MSRNAWIDLCVGGGFGLLIGIAGTHVVESTFKFCAIMFGCIVLCHMDRVLRS